MAMSNESYTPRSGRIFDAEGQEHNIVDLLGGGTPVSDAVYDINSYAPAGGLILGSDGKAYDLTQLLAGIGSGSSGDPETPERPTLYHAVCDTEPATIIKALRGLPDGYALESGDIILVLFTGGTNTAVACQFTVGSVEYPILFNGLPTNATASAWKLNGLFPFYFDGESFNQLCYAKETDSNTTYTGFFDQNLASMKLVISGTRTIDRYQLVLEKTDGTFEKVLTGNYSTSKTKAVNTAAEFKVDGLMWYYATSTALAANAVVVATTNYRQQTHQSTNFINYALNGADRLSTYSWVYLVGIPQADPLVFKLDPGSVTSWYTSDKPVAEDGKIYIKLGYYSDGTIFSLFSDHPAYWFRDGLFRPYLT